MKLTIQVNESVNADTLAALAKASRAAESALKGLNVTIKTTNGNNGYQSQAMLMPDGRRFRLTNDQKALVVKGVHTRDYFYNKAVASVGGAKVAAAKAKKTAKSKPAKKAAKAKSKPAKKASKPKTAIGKALA